MRKPSFLALVTALLCAIAVLVPLEVRLQAAITVTEKAVLSTTDNNSTYTTTTGTWTTHAGATTFSLATGSVGVCFLAHTDADLGVNEIPSSFTQTGQTWTLDPVLNQPRYNTTGTPIGEIEVFTSPGAAASAAGVSYTYGDAQTGSALHCYELASASGAALQSKVGAADSATNHTVTMDLARTANSILLHMVAAGGGTFTAEYSGVGTASSYGTPGNNARVQWDIGGADITPLFTSASQNSGSYAIEIAVASAGGTAKLAPLLGVGLQ